MTAIISAEELRTVLHILPRLGVPSLAGGRVECVTFPSPKGFPSRLLTFRFYERGEWTSEIGVFGHADENGSFALDAESFRLACWASYGSEYVVVSEAGVRPLLDTDHNINYSRGFAQ